MSSDGGNTSLSKVLMLIKRSDGLVETQGQRKKASARRSWSHQKAVSNWVQFSIMLYDDTRKSAVKSFEADIPVHRPKRSIAITARTSLAILIISASRLYHHSLYYHASAVILRRTRVRP